MKTKIPCCLVLLLALAVPAIAGPARPHPPRSARSASSAAPACLAVARQWSAFRDGGANDTAVSMVTDGQGNVYVTGSGQGASLDIVTVPVIRS